MEELEFKELLFSRPSSEMAIMRSAAFRLQNGEEESIMMCKVYFPAMSLSKSRQFLTWLAVQAS